MRPCPAVLLALALLTFMPPGPVPTAEPDLARADQQTLKAAGLAPDGPALLDYFRKQTLDDAQRRQIEDLIRRLGDDSFAARERAAAELVQRHARDALLRAEQARWQGAEATLQELDDLARLLAHASLHAAGYHRHDQGEWRRRHGHS